MRSLIITLFASFGLSFLASSQNNFLKIRDARELEGTYLNRSKDGDILSLFNISDYADFVSLKFESPNEIKLTYKNASPMQKEFVFKGQMKKKFFEYYFQKTEP